jgi:hypothetical protein
MVRKGRRKRKEEVTHLSQHTAGAGVGAGTLGCGGVLWGVQQQQQWWCAAASWSGLVSWGSHAHRDYRIGCRVLKQRRGACWSRERAARGSALRTERPVFWRTVCSPSLHGGSSVFLVWVWRMA